MTDFNNPYQPPDAALAVPSLQPQSVRMAIFLILASFPLGVARLMLQSNARMLVVLFVALLFAAYLIWLARLLHRGRRGAWWWVVITSIYFHILNRSEYIHLSPDAHSAVKIAQAAVITACMVLLLTPTARAWFFSRPA